MSKLSLLRDGSFYYIEKLDTVDECFADALAGLFSAVAENVKIQIQVNNEHEYMKKLNICKTYGDFWKKNNNGYEISLKYIINGFSKEFIFEIEIPAVGHQLSDINKIAEIV